MKVKKYKYNYIYETTNKINGKIYVGQHSSDKHPDNDNYIGSGTAFNNAVKKYGKKNFIRIILDWCLPCQTYIDHKEEQWVAILEAQNKGIGYNIASGGGSPMKGLKHSKQTKEKISKSHIGIKHTDEVCKLLSSIASNRIGSSNPFYGKKHSGETKNKISIVNKGKLKGKNNPFYGKTHTEEAKEKIGIANSKRIISEETRNKLSFASKKRFNKKVECSHCGKIGSGPVMNRFHFNNCKFKK